ncbi:hypothetical protein GH714_010106 [Hevea brasiliensis]|uniref:LIM zinc-binding domain-containing protein n=1 Tax=Hevea brasiliensis TaxID=3981 RepID=A0A6A6MM72_HEVBR|nr:hypothetical protein GH714_010106 [Hevea brasiliensis]
MGEGDPKEAESDASSSVPAPPRDQTIPARELKETAAPVSNDPKTEMTSTDRDAELAKVESEKRYALIKAWEENEKAKVENKTHKKLSAVASQETTKKAYVDTKIKKYEEKIEKKKAKYAEKKNNKIAEIHRAAEEKRAMIEAKRGEQCLKVEEIAATYRSLGHMPRSGFGVVVYVRHVSYRFTYVTLPRSWKQARAPSKISSMFCGTQDKCARCNKTAYPLEKVSVEGEFYHKTCFRCSHGGCYLTPSSYAALDGILYCKPHFAQLFKEKGCYNHVRKSASVKKNEANAQEEKPEEEESKITVVVEPDPEIMARKANPDVSYLEVEKSFYENKGFKVQADGKPVAPVIKKPSQPVGKAMDNTKRSVPNVILRKPAMFVEDDGKISLLQGLKWIKPNLTLKMRNDQAKGKFSDMTLQSSETGDGAVANEQELEDDSRLGMQPLDKSNIGPSTEETATNVSSDGNSVDSTVNISSEATLQGKPKRFDFSLKEASTSIIEEMSILHPESHVNVDELLNRPPTSPLEDADWSKAEDLLRTGHRGEVELVSSSTRGFVVSFGSLLGFLPYRNLAAKWKFLAFESWLKQKGFDPSIYKQNLGIIGSYDVLDKNLSPDSRMDPVGQEIAPDMKLEDLLRIYDQEKLKFLSSFVGQRIKVNVVMADRKLRKLIVSLRPKEKEESIQKKRYLMVEGVPALIHQTEVSWDATVDPASYFKVGQIVEAKVHQLDFTMERIFLSLKEITPDPLIEALESVVGDRDSFDGRLQAVQADSEWTDVESLIKELQQIEGIQSVTKGRFFLSPGLAPTFQLLAIAVIIFGVWMSTHHDSCRRSLTLPVLGLGAFIFVMYKEYELQDFSSWFLKERNNTQNWKRLKSCLVKSDDCNNLSKIYKTPNQYKSAKLTPIEAGCCRPPSE